MSSGATFAAPAPVMPAKSITPKNNLFSLIVTSVLLLLEKYQSPEIFTLFNGELHVMKMPPEEEKEQKESRKNDAKQKNPAKKKNRSGDAR